MTSGTVSCPHCGIAVPADARFCHACGAAVARLSPGQILDGKYEILDKIGEGGMGEVFRARHIHLDEVRIIKVTKPVAPGAAPGGVSGEARRFQEEARMATLVRHPNVAALYDFSRLPDGSYYMVWEFIDGVTLQAWLRRHGPLPVGRALEVASQVLAGLAEIHAQGIVHRDLSPDNIMLRETSSGRLQAKIIDLGIAKRVAEESLQMTGTGLFLGKLKYCSPEQAGALPPGGTLDGRSDLYSFGVVLYEMLSGKAPFESETPEGYIGKHLHEDAPRLDASKLPRGTGPALSGAIARALEKRRERRYGSAREFSEALARIPIPVSEAEAEPKAASAAKRRMPAAIAGVLALVAVVIGIVWATRKTGESSARRRPAFPSAVRRTPLPAAATARPTPAPSPIETPPPATTSSAPAAKTGATGVTEPPVPTPPAPPAPEHDSPPIPPPSTGAAGPSPNEARAALQRWKSRPDEVRARRATEIARLANRFVEAHPDTPFAAEIRESLPTYLRAQATQALDGARPLDAVLYFRAYRQLSFAPPAPDLAARIERVR